MQAPVAMAQREFFKFDVPPQRLYAAVRDHLLGSSEQKYYPLSYLDQLDAVKPWQLSVTVLARKMSLLLAHYDASRKRLAFRMQRFTETSGTYAAWLYKRLFLPIKRLFVRPTNITPQPPQNIYSKIIIQANIAGQSLMETEKQMKHLHL